MSERKVIQKYYPPDFDPSALTRRKGGPKQSGPKFVPVRLMAPFSMVCTRCGEYIAKGRKFNARKQVTDETYLAIKVIRFYIRCTRCSGEITFKTDPRNNDYTAEQGAKRNFEAWRDQSAIEETDEQRLDRLEASEAQDVVKEVDAMTELEAKGNEMAREMAIADALDEIRTRNARIERADRDGKGQDVSAPSMAVDEEKARRDKEDEEAAKRAFFSADGDRVKRLVNDGDGDGDGDGDDGGEKEEQRRRTESTTKASIGASFGLKTKKRKNNFAIPGLVKKKVAA